MGPEMFPFRDIEGCQIPVFSKYRKNDLGYLIIPLVA